MPVVDANRQAGISPTDKFRVGRSDVDRDTPIEANLTLPWPSDPACSYIYFECAVGSMLDSGIVVHNRLPQVDNTPDTLSVIDFDDPKFEQFINPGVNLRCRDQYTDIVQRMGHARYWFRLWGRALRIGYQVPIPGLVKVGGVPAIPYDKNPQWAFNRIFPRGNYGGIIMWHAEWSLWYTTAVPPQSNYVPATDPSAHIRGDAPLPSGIAVPTTFPDDAARPAAPNFGETAGAGIGQGVVVGGAGGK